MSESQTDSLGPDDEPARSALEDVLAAIVCAAFGGPVGGATLLAIACLVTRESPKSGDYEVVFQTIPIGGVIVGVVIGATVRMISGPIRRPWLWAAGFFLLGLIGCPLTVIAAAAFAIAGTGGW